jgi:hypothetical protein
MKQHWKTHEAKLPSRAPDLSRVFFHAHGLEFAKQVTSVAMMHDTKAVV